MNDKNQFLMKNDIALILVLSYLSSDKIVTSEAIAVVEEELCESPGRGEKIECLFTALITSRQFPELERLIVFMYKNYMIRDISLDIYLGCTLHRDGVVNFENLMNKAKSYPYQKVQLLAPPLKQMIDTLLHIREDIEDGFSSINECSECTKKRNSVLGNDISQFIKTKIFY